MDDKIVNRRPGLSLQGSSLNEYTDDNKSEYLDILWLCLKQDCVKNCCGKLFNNGDAVNIFNMHHDQVPLLLLEKNLIIRRRGPEYVKRGKDGLFYLNIPEKGSCPFLKRGKCNIQDIKPSLCKAYPLIQLDCHVGPVFDHDNCPGFALGEKLGIHMKKSDYIIMLENFISLQQYRLDRVRLELNNLIYRQAT
jgi:hypothetical protein